MRIEVALSLVMGSVHTRGNRTQPRFYLSFRAGVKPDGSPAYVMRAFKGATNKREARAELARIETAIAQGRPWEHEDVVVPEPRARDMPTLLREWMSGLQNRAAVDDARIVKRDLIPAFTGRTIDEVRPGVVMRWLDALAKTKMSGQTKLHRFNLLSRFFSWAVDRELVDANSCRSVPRGKRPVATREHDVPWLEDDDLIPVIMAKLEAASAGLGLMFYLGRFSGLREGEVAGLRMSDVEDWLPKGLIRARYSYAGPLKEDRNGTGKSKRVPAPTDALDVLKLHLKRRKLQGAKGEDLVFTYDRPSRRRGPKWKNWAGYHPHTIQSEFRLVADELGLVDLDWYRSTRHSFATKALSAGASLDEVSAALGHSSPVVTRKHYDHLIRESYSMQVRQGLSAGGQSAGSASDGQPSRRG
jgi:integrase